MNGKRSQVLERWVQKVRGSMSNVTQSQLHQVESQFVSSEPPHITVLICALNEAENLPHVLPKIPSFVDEVLLVDGHSTDGTVDVARKLYPNARILHQPAKGKADALRFGIQQASGDIIVTIDADGSNNPEELMAFVEPLTSGFDFAKGSRFLHSHSPEMPIHRHIGNRIIATVTNLLHRTNYTDLCCGYNAFWKDVFGKAKLDSSGFGYEPEIVLKARKAGLKIVEVPCIDQGRISGESKLPNFRQGWGAIRTVVIERLRG